MNKRNIVVSQIKERLKYSSLLITPSEYKEDIFKDTVFLQNSTERNTDKTFYQTLVLHRAPKRKEYRKLGYCLCWRLLWIKNEGWYFFNIKCRSR